MFGLLKNTRYLRFTHSQHQRHVHKGAKVNLYETLKVDEDATLYELKSALAARSVAKLWQKRPELARKLLVAYTVLSDNRTRNIYDETGHFNENTSFNENAIFAQIESDKPYIEAKRPIFNLNKGENCEANAEIPFLDSLIGTSTLVKYTTLRQCKKCLGTGSSQRLAPKKCKPCGGTGIDAIQALKQANDVKCKSCHGEGSFVKDKCKSCAGTGLSTVERSMNVDIPSGIQEGDFVKVDKEGNFGIRMGEAGDLYVKVKISPHPHMKRDGDELIIDYPITMSTAILGGQGTVPTLVGERVVVIPPNTNPGDTVTIKDSGIKLGTKRGNVVVKFNIVLPKAIGMQGNLIRKLASEVEDININIDWEKENV